MHTTDEINVPSGLGPPFPTIGYGRLPYTEVFDTKVFGWGAVSERGSLSNKLLQLDVSLVEPGICNSPVSYAGRVSDDMICAKSKIPGIDACSGFSGSGLILFSTLAPELIGLVSWGEGCAKEGKPTVYVNVGHFHEWISRYISERG